MLAYFLVSLALAGPLEGALVVGDCEQALSTPLPDPLSPALALAVGRCAISEGQTEQALALLTEVNEPRFIGHAQALVGAAHLAANAPIEAVQALQKADADPLVLPPLRDQVQLQLGQALLAIEDPTGAADVLRPMLDGALARPGALPTPGGVDPAEVRWWLAQSAIDRAMLDKAVPLWRTIWVRNPTSPYAHKAADALRAAERPVPDPATAEGRTLIQTRIRTLERLTEHKRALALRELLPLGHDLREARALAGAVFRAKDYGRAATLLSQLSKRTPDEGVLLALAKVRSGDPDGSILVYVDLAAGEGRVAELARYKLGYMAYDQGQLSDAITALDHYLDLHPSGRFVDDALWFSAMAELRLGALVQADQRMSRLASEHPRSSLIPGATYWRARIQGMQGNTAKEEAALARFIEAHPRTGYAWFAAHRLNKRWSAPPTTPPGPPSTESDSMGTALASAGLLAWARPHLQKEIPSAKRAGKEAALKLSEALITAGAYKEATALVGGQCGKPGKTGWMASNACWPRPSASMVSSVASEAGLPPSLPFAIMTAESALDPSVTSPAGARGLMQLMPEVAEQLHNSAWPARSFNPDDLFQPAYNATLGTQELARLRTVFTDASIEPTLPLVIAGYNAGPEAVQRWLDAYHNGTDADLWAETIGYTETRKYVRRVLGYLQTYRMVYGDPEPSNPG